MKNSNLIIKYFSPFSKRTNKEINPIERNISNLIAANIAFIACLDDNDIDVFPIKGRSNHFVYIVSRYAKNRTIVMYKNGNITEINIRSVRKWFGEKAERIEADIEQERPYYSKIFADGMPNKAYKKPRKKGFYKTYTANEVQENIIGVFY